MCNIVKLKLGDIDELNKYSENNHKDYDINILIDYFINLKNKNGQQYNALGFLYHDLKEYNSAIICYRTASNYGCNASLNNLGFLYHSLKNYNNAIIYYKKAINNNCVEAMNNLGFLYKETKDYNNAIIYYKMAASVDINNSVKMINPIYKYKNSINYTNENNDNCVICLDLLDNTTIVYNCFHKIHYGCHLQLTSGVCPLCRASI
jgi:tetratricopeptide (TPR) repeat protein